MLTCNEQLSSVGRVLYKKVVKEKIRETKEINVHAECVKFRWCVSEPVRKNDPLGKTA